jgi:cysteine desulfurase
VSTEPLFLDANASVPALPEARATLAEVAALRGNPSSPHAMGRALRRRLDDARAAVAAALGGAAKEVVFTSGATEGNRWLTDTLVRRGRQAGAPLRVATTPLEHPSLARPLARAAEEGDLVVTELAVDETGAVDTAALADADAVFVTAAHNETGILPRLADVLAAARDDAVVACDAAQATGRLPPLPARVDAVVASAHKMGGVAGAGALLVRGRAAQLPSPWAGGGQEDGRRPGTEALAVIAAFGAAAARVEQVRAAHAALAPLRDRLEEALVDAWGARALGAGAERLANTSALVVPGVDGEALRMSIDLAGVCVGFGSACSALAPEPSPALLALGLDRAQARATVRLSLAPDADEGLIAAAIKRLSGALPR